MQEKNTKNNFLTVIILFVYISDMTPLEIRFASGLTQQQDADRVFSRQSTISNIETGKRKPGKNLLLRYRKAFPEMEIDTAEFLGI